jgi:hypothetical protein
MNRNPIAHALCAVAISLTPATAVAASDATAINAPAPASVEATKLASLILPYELFVKSNKDSFTFGFNETVKGDAGAIALFEAYPGIREAIVTAQLEALETLIEREYGVLMGLLGQHNDRSYTKTELTALTGFFASAIGKRLIAAEYGAVDQRKVLDALSDDDAVLTKQENAEIAKGAPQRIFNSLTKAEQVESMRFWTGPLGRKVNANGPKLQEITRVWLNELNATNLKNVEALSLKVVREFIEKSEAAKTAS